MTNRMLLTVTVGAVVACGGRPDHWDASVELPATSAGLSGSIAVVDDPLHRVVMLTSSSDGALATSSVPVGQNVVAVHSSPDRDRLFVLSNGQKPRRNPDDERPSLTVIDGGLKPERVARYALTDPLQGLAVDPQGEWVVVFDAGGIVVNPNELIFVDVQNPGVEPFPKTIRSFGGRPQRLTFTSELSVPNGEPRRFLVVETDRDVTLLDLSDLARDEVTIQLPKTPTGQPGSPLEVDFHEGDPSNPADSRIAIRLENDPNVVLAELGSPPPESGDKPFQVTLNVADVGGAPSSVAFVQTDAGLRLAALVPSTRSAALIDPLTSVVDTAELPKAFSRLTRITADVAAPPEQSDVALLWSEQTNGVAFWSLGATGTLFRSVEPLEIGISVRSVESVQGDRFAHLKILESATAPEFYVLDLDARQSFPMLTDAVGFEVMVSPDGERVWAFRPGTPEVASVTLEDLHPRSVELERDVFAVYDIARADGGRAAVALHALAGTGRGVSLGATVLDAIAPDTAHTRFYGGLMLGGFE